MLKTALFLPVASSLPFREAVSAVAASSDRQLPLAESKSSGHGLLTKTLLVMKLTFFFLTAAFLHVHATGISQNISFSGKDVSVKAVFASVEKQTGYVFLFKNKTLSDLKPVSLDVKDMPLQSFLDLISAQRDLSFVIKRKTISVQPASTLRNPDTSTIAGSSDRQSTSGTDELFSSAPIRGKVLDSVGRPLSGATIAIKNNEILGVTDAEGVFSVNVSEGDVLLISFVGYETRQVVVTKSMFSSANNLVITLKPSIDKLDDVEVTVNTGYQKIPKERTTGSFAFIDSNILNRNVDPNILNRIDGLAPGLLFDKRNPNSPNIQIRGVYSLDQETAAPLIVLNNFPYTGDIGNINPNDIESITILRDAAAASVWGAKAGNGVIVITTKNGSYNKPLSVSVNSSIKITGKPRLFTRPILSTSEQVDLEKYFFEKGWFDFALMDPYTPVPDVVSILENQRNGKISQDEATKQIDALRKYDVRNDYLKYLYRKAIQQQYSLSLSGGSSANKYYLSAGYDKSLESLITNDNYRITFQAGNTLKISKIIQASANITFTNGVINLGPASLPYGSTSLGARVLPQYSRLADERGNPLSIDAFSRSSFLDTLGQGALLDWKYRPLDEAKFADNVTRSNNLLASVNIQAAILKGLTAELSYQFQYNNAENKNNQKIESYYTRDLINSYTNLSETEQQKRYPVPVGGILDLFNSSSITHNVRGQINFSKELAPDHRIDLMGGVELRQIKLKSNTDRVYGYNSEILSYSNVDYVNQYPRFYWGNLDRITSGKRMDEIENRLVSAFFNGSYTLYNNYVLSASVRKDASNLFGVNTNDKGRPFYSIGALWRFSNEKFYDVGFLPNLNFRATYGTGGNILANASALPIMLISAAESNPIVGLPYASINSLGNPNLKWEKVSTFNVGIDFGLKNNIISGSIEFYRKRSTDLYSNKPVDPTVGFPLIQTNAADIKGGGFDIQLTSKNFNRANFKWSTTLNFSQAQYKVSKYAIKFNEKGFTFDGSSIFPIEGINPYSIISYKWAGLDPQTGDPQGYVDGKISKDYSSLTQAEFKDLVVNGSALPQVFGNLLNSFSWKNFTLSTNITYKFSYYFRKPTINYINLFAIGATHTDYLRRWQKSGDEKSTSVPSMIWPYNNLREKFYTESEVNVLRGDHIRLNDVQLTYSLTKKQFSKLPVGNIVLYATLSNLNILIWKANHEGVDPENVSGKTAKSFVIGAKVTL